MGERRVRESRDIYGFCSGLTSNAVVLFSCLVSLCVFIDFN